MHREDFDKLKDMYTQLIELVCYAKETDFSPYTHFYTQVLIDIIVKTYNTKTFRTDLLYKSQIGVPIDNSKYYPSEIFKEFEEDEYTTQILLLKWIEKIDKISTKKHNEYLKFFETMRDLLIENLCIKKQI